MPKNLLTSVLPLFISVLLTIIVAKYGIEKVSSVRAEISQAQNDRATLSEKLNILQTLGATVQAGSQAATIALPDKNPAIVVLSQMKSLAGQNLISISNLKMGASSKEATLESATIAFDALGPKEGVFAFLGAIEKIAPITVVDKMKMAESGGQVRATITVKAFWAAFPTKLPAVTQAITGLTSAEEKTLQEISTLVPPQFAQITPSEGAGKTDPFAP